MSGKAQLSGRGAVVSGRAATGELVPIDVALQRGLRLATPVDETEQVTLAEALGRVTSAAVTSAMSLPPFDN